MNESEHDISRVLAIAMTAIAEQPVIGAGTLSATLSRFAESADATGLTQEDVRVP